LKESEDKKVSALYQHLARWHKLAHNQDILEVLSVILDESGFLNYLLQQSTAQDQLAKLQSFYEEIRELSAGHPGYRLADFFDHLDTLRRHGLGLEQKVLPPRSGVRLMTAHRSKGLEFRHVYIVRVTDGHFGHRRAQTSLLPKDEDENSERRLFYVALTRARESVTISYAKTTRDGRPQLPSQYVLELKPEYVEQVAVPETEINIVERLKPANKAPRGLAEKEYLNNLFRERGFSATDLNTYLKCPLQYYYEKLLRLPVPTNKHMIYGTAVHAALKEFFDAYKVGTLWNKGSLLECFRHHLHSGTLSSRDSADSLQKGERALGGYFEAYQGTWGRDLLTELNARVLWGEMWLNGRVDKLELLSNGQTRVVDYKTSKPKSRNHILGLTKADDSGDYYRQLLFYKLLLEHHQPRKYHVSTGVIDFIEPDEKGRYKQEEFELEQMEVEKLVTQIKQIEREILSLEFLEQGCGEKDCEYCRLWQVTR
jgi:DNA helicase-2/ATP-dependent DNA helicase PcrA